MLSFDMTYVYIAAGVVVLLLALLLILRRRRAKPGGAKDEGFAPPQFPPAEAVAAGAAPPVEAQWTDAAPPTPIPAVSPLAVGGPFDAAAPVAPVGTAPLTPAFAVTAAVAPLTPHPGGSDPAAALVTSLLQSSGDLSPEELRRLELYRPERIMAAADVMAEKLGGRGNEAKRTRLARIRQYADSLHAEFEPEAKTFTPSAVVIAETSRPEDHVIGRPGGDDAPPPPEAWGASSGGSTLLADPELSLHNDEPEPAPIPVSANILDPAPPAAAAFVLSQAVSQPAPEPEQAPTLVDEPTPAVMYEPAFAGATEVVPEQVARVVPEQVHWEEPAEAVATMESLHIDIRRAEDVLALPPRERTDSLGFLSPAELGRLLELSDDEQLQMRAIDTLEQFASPDALQVLQAALSNPDPEIQVYALSAAERLLGT